MYTKLSDTQVLDSNAQAVTPVNVTRDATQSMNISNSNADTSALTNNKKRQSRFNENDTVLFATEICCGEVLEIVKECIEANAELVLTDIEMNVHEMAELAKARQCNIIVASANIWNGFYAALNVDDKSVAGLKALLVEDGELKENRFYWVPKAVSKDRSNDIFAAYQKAPAIRNGLADDAWGRQTASSETPLQTTKLLVALPVEAGQALELISDVVTENTEVHFADTSMNIEAASTLLHEKGINEIVTTPDRWLQLNQNLNNDPGAITSLTVHLFLNDQACEERFYWIPAALSAADLHDPYAAYQLAPAIRNQQKRERRAV